ncbi:MAG: hypothetical protein J5506_08700 [Prevotella sp.]|nr:hypothetical protein [Prevotella sp.]
MKKIKEFGTILIVVLGMTMFAACSSSIDSIDNGEWDESGLSHNGDSHDYGFTSLAFVHDLIPVELKDFSELPGFLQKGISSWDEREVAIGRFKIFEGKCHGESIYYFDNLFSSCIGCRFYHEDGRQLKKEEWITEDGVVSYDIFSDWKCIYSADPFVKGITGVFRYDPDQERRGHYVEANNKYYFIWGYLNTENLKKYDGKFVQIGGFSGGDITQALQGDESIPSGITCYGIETTYIRICKQ